MMRIVSGPKHPNNEWYEELCALAAIGELSSSELEDLQHHLVQCGDCRELYAELGRISADDLGSVAVLKKLEQATAETGVTIDEDQLLTRLLDRARREPATGNRAGTLESATMRRISAHTGSIARIMHWLQRPALSYGTVALLLCVVATVAGFRLREVQLTPTLQGLNAQVSSWKNRTETAEGNEKAASELLLHNQSERESLQKLLGEMQAKYIELENERNGYRAQIADAKAQLEERGKELEGAKNSEAEKNERLAELEAKLRDANQRTEQQEVVVANLRNKLWEETSRKPETQNFDDVEAKNLFGARDLHIVDVYDVGSSGQTRRTYGRVYFVAKKLLIFYAFDLQDKQRNRMAAGFQAWGYRQPNETTPQNLGLFSPDDSVENRWVLKVNDPRVLERIDAVFVTLETPNGSPSPRGRRILYANLAGPANHP